MNENPLCTAAGTLRLCIVGALLSLAACGGTSTVTLDNANNRSFDNILVVGIAANYELRAQVERSVVSGIRRLGATGTPSHQALGGNRPISRDAVVNLVTAEGYDAVLSIRQVDSSLEMDVEASRTETDATPIGGRVFNLFRSDYTNYTTPASVDFVSSATLLVELYDSASSEVVFAFDYETGSDENVGLLIDRTASDIVSRLDRSDLITR